MDTQSNVAGQDAHPSPPETLEETCNRYRAGLKGVEDAARNIAAHCFAEKQAEAGAQAMLAVRHIEDARMRIGKVIQYATQGGVSVYDTMKRCAQDGCRTTMSAGSPRFCPEHNDKNP
jgi:hypothetical protein